MWITIFIGNHTINDTTANDTGTACKNQAIELIVFIN